VLIILPSNRTINRYGARPTPDSHRKRTLKPPRRIARTVTRLLSFADGQIPSLF